jgi:hypothetical protein
MGTLFAVVVATLTISILLLFGGCSSRTSRTTPPAGSPANSSTGASHTAKPNAAPAPPENTKPHRPVNAMCYRVAPKTSRLDYTCPKCGERTLYETTEGSHASAVATMVDAEISWCRRELEYIRRTIGGGVSLEESQFCQECSPNVTSPKLVVRISLPNGDSREIEVFSHDDLHAAILALKSGKLPTQTRFA